MKKRSHLFATLFTALCAAMLFGTVAAAQQQPHPMLDAVANKVVQHYQNSSCQQLQLEKAQKKNMPMSPGEQKLIELLRTDQQMRHEFIGIVADRVVDKMVQCGMVP